MTVFIGVDLTAGTRPISYVVLDAQRALLARGEGSFDDVLSLVTGYERAICAVDAPQGHNAGLMADPEYRARLGIPRSKKSYTAYRVCEYELRRRGIGLYNTPLDPEDAQGWMQVGWRFYRALWDADFVNWPGGNAGRQVLEIHPHACYTAMLGHRPLRKTTLEGRLQRQLVLHRAGVDVPNPMRALTELTPHRLLMGDISMVGLLYDHDTLDAAAAAYTAWLAANRPDDVTAAGDPDEGTIVVPARELKEQYDKA